MPTRTCPADLSSLFADGPGSHVGGGADQHLPVGGPWNGYTFRSAIRFALDWTDVRTLVKATLRIKTSSQIHIGFSSVPDIYVRRCAQTWQANSSSVETGGSWGVNPTVYPGPSATTTGQAQKRIPITEATWVDIDVTTLAREWAPTSVANGGGKPNYGVLLVAVEGSDRTEFASKAIPADAPRLILDYSTDAAPVTTPATPSGIVTTATPTLVASATDADGDAVTSFEFEVLRAGSTAYLSGPQTPTSVGAPWSCAHVVATPLPSGDATWRARATSGGLTGAWSAELAITIDRPPAMGAWSAPPATTASRRPVHTVAWSDADLNAGELYEIEIYGSAGGGTIPPAGVPFYKATNQTTGLGASSISHTPTVDLPGGEMSARVRVRARGVWSAWSAYRVYTITLAVPTLRWSWPEVDGGWSLVNTAELLDPARTLDNVAMRLLQITYAPPSGTTVTTLRLKLVVEDPGIGGPVAGTVLLDANQSVVAGGTTFEYAYRPGAVYPGWIAGTITCTVTITCANAANVSEIRRTRWALGDWLGAIALGDGAAAIASLETAKVDDVAMLYRAQSSPTVANGAAPWRPPSALATVSSELPATNAYLGLRARISRRPDDSPRNADPSFEDPALAGWIVAGAPGANSGSIVRAGVPDGSRCLQLIGGTAYPGYFQRIPIIVGAWYRLAGYLARPTGAGRYGTLMLIWRDAAGALTGTQPAIVGTTDGWTRFEVYGQAPAGAATVDVVCRINSSTTIVADAPLFDDVRLAGIVEGDQGMDRLALSWTSLG